MRSLPLAVVTAGVLLAGCAGASPRMSEEPPPPWKSSDGAVEVTGAPDAGGVLSFRNCPTLDEARAAVPAITEGPDANAVRFKSMVLQCSYGLPGRDVQGRPAGIAILVFDASLDGETTFAWTLDGDEGSPTPIDDLGDSAYWTAGRGSAELWVNAGRFGLHLLNTGVDASSVREIADLARAAVGALERPPR